MLSLLGNRIKRFRNTPQTLLTDSAGAANDNFGTSVAVSGDGNRVIIGSPNDDNGANADQGSVIIFVRNGTTWTQEAKLVEPTTPGFGAATYQFGFAVALSYDGSTAIIGAPYDENKGLDAGAFTIYTRSGSTWTYQTKITEPSPGRWEANGYFGWSVALSNDGNTALVGCPGISVSGMGDRGEAAVYTRTGSSWNYQATLAQSTGAANDFCGYSVALSSDGNTAIIGTPYDDVGAFSNQGSATIFTRSGTTWTQQQTITQASGKGSDYFGWSVDLSGDGNTAIIGVPYGDSFSQNGTGEIVFFTRSSGVWSEQQTLFGDTNAGLLGYSVSLSADGNIGIAGAAEEDIAGIVAAGSVTTYIRLGTTWQRLSKISNTNKVELGKSGNSVGLSAAGGIIVMGTPGDDIGANNQQGSATVFYRR